jgi:predicted metal-dependent HD superfamily phosphohydrolase
MDTKSHQVDNNKDANYFTDAGLSILGAEEALYHLYKEQTRKEYRFYPGIVYKPGGKKF